MPKIWNKNKNIHRPKTETAGKGRRKIAHRGWVAIVAAVSVVAVAGYLLFQKPDLEGLDQTYVSQLTVRDVQQGVQSGFEEKELYNIQDYAWYGETLTLYQSDYQPLLTDSSLGLTVLLRNVETGQEQSFVFSGTADAGIQAGDLEPGVYEIYIYEQFVKKRVYTEDVWHTDALTTVRRDGVVNEVMLVSDAGLFEEQQLNLDRNYAFLVVTEQIPRVKTVDVIIDPGGNVYSDASMTVDPGISYGSLSEANLSMELAGLVRGYLEDAGLRVAFTRTGDKTPSYYGESGRPAQGYDRQAKVYLNLAMVSEEDTSRPYLMTSPYTAASLASQIAYTMQAEGVEMEYLGYDAQLNSAVAYDGLQQNEDWSYNEFEWYPALRETGGKITSAGTMDGARGNSEYADAYGMYGIIFRFANAASEDSMTYYEENKEAIAKALADGILEYYGIENHETAAQ